MNAEAIAQEYNENGCALIRGVFSKPEVAEIERQVADFILDLVPTLKAGDVFYEDTPDKPIKSMFRLEKAPFFQRLMNDPRLTLILNALWPNLEIAPRREAMFFGKAARSGTVISAHQDNIFQNVQPPEAVVCTIAIDESTPANGVLCAQKGSHRLGVLPHRPTGIIGISLTVSTPLDRAKYPEIQLCMKPGDMCLHHTNVVHYSGPNATDKSRRQLGLQFYSARAKRDEEGWARYQAELKKLNL